MQPWTSTTHTLLLLRDLGLDPASPAASRAVDLVANSRWEHAGQRYFSGEVEPCINGMTVAIGAYFGHHVQGIVDRLLSEQLDDGGWNCEAENGSVRSSFHTTISVLDGLLEHERATGGGSAAVTAARLSGQEYLLERRLFRRRSTGEVGDPFWTLFSFPTRWHYDVLRGLDHLRSAGAVHDERCNEALDLLEQRRGNDGRWPLQNPHPGAVHFELEEGEGRPSRWNTLRALRVLRWAGRDASTGTATSDGPSTARSP